MSKDSNILKLKEEEPEPVLTTAETVLIAVSLFVGLCCIAYLWLA